MNASLVSVAFAIPQLLLIAGLVVALVLTVTRREALGRAGVFAMTGIGLLIFNLVFDILWSLVVPWVAQEQDSFLLFASMRHIASSLMFGAGLALLIVAIFVGRPGNRVTPGPDRTVPPGGPLS